MNEEQHDKLPPPLPASAGVQNQDIEQKRNWRSSYLSTLLLTVTGVFIGFLLGVFLNSFF